MEWSKRESLNVRMRHGDDHEMNEPQNRDTKETLQNKQTKGTHMLQVCVHIKHVVMLVVLRIRVINSVIVNVPKY